MKNKQKPTTPALDAHEIKGFRSFVLEKARQLSEARTEARQQLQLLVEIDDNLSAKQAILLYLRMFKDEPISTQELEIVSGISEYARRIRELVSEGHAITTATVAGRVTYTFRFA